MISVVAHRDADLEIVETAGACMHARLAAMVQDGTLRSIISERVKIDGVIDAFKRSSGGHANGKIVVSPMG